MTGSDKRIVIFVTVLLMLALGASAVIAYAGTMEEDNTGKAGYTKEQGIPKKVAYLRSDTYTTPFGTFEPIEKVLERNEYMTLHPSVIEGKAALDYITPTEDADKAVKIMENVAALADKICDGIENDYDKVTALAMWVGQNVAYDMDTAQSDVYALSVISLEAVTENGFKTTCAGFSNLFSALCFTQDIYCLNMKGGTSSEGWSRSELLDAPANHEWNAVAVDGEWYYVDCTWISDYSYENGEYTEETKCMPFYSAMGFGEMSIEHRIDRCEYRNYASAGK